MKEMLVMMKEKRQPSVPKRLSSYVKCVVGSVDLLDDLEDKKESKRPEKGIQLSITALMKKLITEVTPPTDNGQLYIINQKDMETIYKIIEEEKIDFDDLP